MLICNLLLSYSIKASSGKVLRLGGGGGRQAGADVRVETIMFLWLCGCGGGGGGGLGRLRQDIIIMRRVCSSVGCVLIMMVSLNIFTFIRARHFCSKFAGRKHTHTRHHCLACWQFCGHKIIISARVLVVVVVVVAAMVASAQHAQGQCCGDLQIMIMTTTTKLSAYISRPCRRHRSCPHPLT